MRPLLLLPLLSVFAAAEDYDCAVGAEKAAFVRGMKDLKDANRQLYAGASAKKTGQEKDSSDARQCTVAQWCVNLDAKVKFAPSSGGVVMRVYSAPSSSCSSPWAGSCDKKDGPCSYATAPLAGGPPARITKEGPASKVNGQAPAFEKSSGNKGDFDGPTFAVKDKAFKVHPKKRQIFERLEGGKLSDTGFELPPEVYEELCAAAACPARRKK